MKRPIEPLTAPESLFLDIVRVSAACLVAVGHLTQAPFSAGWPDLTYLALSSVAVFLVLSGFVIRQTTCRRPNRLSSYLIDRFSRIYSVAVPALLITAVADTISRHVNPHFYARWETDYVHPLLRLLGSLTFSTQFWKFDVNPLSNSPFWSLCYEVSYYVIYGIFFYLKGLRRWMWLVVSVLVIGPKILILFPVWILGACALDAYQCSNRSEGFVRWIKYLSIATVGSLAICGTFLHSHRYVLRLISATRMEYFHANRLRGLGRSSDYLAFYLEGVIFAIALLASMRFIRNIDIDETGTIVKLIRFIAEGTFPIYLIHFPLFVLIASCIPYNHGRAFDKALVLLVVLTICVLLGQPTNKLKLWLKSQFSIPTLGQAKANSGHRDRPGHMPY